MSYIVKAGKGQSLGKSVIVNIKGNQRRIDADLDI